MSRFISGSEPYLLPSGRTGCILLHGFTSMPEETRQLGEFLAKNGVTTLGVRLSGHASHPNDLRHTHWTDWLLDVETAAALLSNITDRVFIIGQSMGGILSLIFSTEYPFLRASAITKILFGVGCFMSFSISSISIFTSSLAVKPCSPT